MRPAKPDTWTGSLVTESRSKTVGAFLFKLLEWGLKEHPGLTLLIVLCIIAAFLLFVRMYAPAPG